MKAIIISHKIAFLMLFMLICISGIIYFNSIADVSYIKYANFNYTRGAVNLIIDPGHGGEDGGAVSKNGTIESSINLQISLKLEQICGFLGLKTIMTRSSEKIDYPPEANTVRSRKVADQKARVSLINNTENAVLISIHQNCYTDSSPFGAQVLYAPTDGSQIFGEYIQNLMIQHLNPDNRRTASLISDNIYLMNNINCPAVLIECGFISNYKEEQLLKRSYYQLKIAAIIASCYSKNFAEF